MRTKKNKNRELDRIIESYRAGEDSCPHFMECGGCYMRQLSYPDQLAVKDEFVRGLFADVIGDLLPEIYEGILPSPAYEGYRNKMEFSFGNMEKDGPLTLGLHRRGSFYDIVPVPECRIVDEDFRRILSLTMEFFRQRNISFFHKKTHEGYLRHLMIRKAYFTGELLVDLVTASWGGEGVGPGGVEPAGVSGAGEGISAGDAEDGCAGGTFAEEELLRSYVNLLTSADYSGTIAGILHTRNDSIADTIIDGGTRTLFGRDYFYEELLGLKFKITPFSFFQTNSAGAQVLYSKAREYLLGALADGDGAKNEVPTGQIPKKHGVLYDLYCGTGTIAQILSPVFDRVVGVEIVEEAVVAARENALRNGIQNCAFTAGDVLKVISDIPSKPDCIVLDPPRDGIHPKALPKLIDFGVPNILYIACKPKSLSRDLPMFLEHGYRPVRMALVDMFPGTANVETVCLLSNTHKKKESYITLDVEMEDYYRIKNEGRGYRNLWSP